MDYKNTLPWLLVFFTSAVSAECYIRSATTVKSNESIERIADFKQEVIPSGSKNICRVTFRAFLKGKWHLATGEEVAQTWGDWQSACAKAQQFAKNNLLDSVSSVQVLSKQDTICTDEPLPKTKAKVQLGQIIKESEVQPHPVHFDNFRYRGALCRWFVESTPRVGHIELNQGILCRLSDEIHWKVVDKW